MKRIVYIIMLVVVAVSMSSCSSVRKVKIVGEPGTVIEVPSQKGTYMIDNTGEVTVPLDRSYYHAYLLSTAPGSNLKVPFALDYKKNNKQNVDVWILGGSVLMYFVVAFTESIPLAMLTSGGMLYSIPAAIIKSGKSDYINSYKYLKRYSTNDDMFGTARRGALYDVLGSSGVTR